MGFPQLEAGILKPRVLIAHTGCLCVLTSELKNVSGGYDWKCSAIHAWVLHAHCPVGRNKLHVAHVAQAVHCCRLADAITLNGAIMSCRQSKKWAEAVCALVGFQGVTR